MNNLVFGILLIAGFAAAFTGSSAIFAHDGGPAAGFVRMVQGGNVTTVARSRAACHPSYRGQCLPAVGPDVDCRDISGRVEVVGFDAYRLDSDSDGIGCEGN